MSALSAWARLLLWDYERGSLPYDLLCGVIVLFLWLVPGSWLGDPMRSQGSPAFDLGVQAGRP